MINLSFCNLVRAIKVVGQRTANSNIQWSGKKYASTVQFDWTDAFNLESQLTEEEILMRDQVKSYCQQKLMPRILEANRHEQPDHGVLKEMGDLGILGPTINGMYVCSSSSSSMYVVVD